MVLAVLQAGTQTPRPPIADSPLLCHNWLYYNGVDDAEEQGGCVQGTCSSKDAVRQASTGSDDISYSQLLSHPPKVRAANLEIQALREMLFCKKLFQACEAKKLQLMQSA